MSEDLVQNLKRAGEQVLGAKGLTGNDHVRLSALLKVAALEVEALRAAEGVARDDAAELRAALKRIHTMFSSTIGDSTAELNRKLVLKVPYAMGIARQTLEKTSDAALAATEGQP